MSLFFHRLTVILVALFIGVPLCCCQFKVFATDVDAALVALSCQKCGTQGEEVPVSDEQEGCGCHGVGNVEERVIKAVQAQSLTKPPAPLFSVVVSPMFPELAEDAGGLLPGGEWMLLVDPVPQRIMFSVFTV